MKDIRDPKQLLGSLLQTLDYLLTGKSETGSTVQHLLDDMYYLSDGGYSRIVYHQDFGTLALTTNSLPQVVERWNQNYSLTIRVAIEQLLKQMEG
jgi:hypothetical protein